MEIVIFMTELNSILWFFTVLRLILDKLMTFICESFIFSFFRNGNCYCFHSSHNISWSYVHLTYLSIFFHFLFQCESQQPTPTHFECEWNLELYAPSKLLHLLFLLVFFLYFVNWSTFFWQRKCFCMYSIDTLSALILCVFGKLLIVIHRHNICLNDTMNVSVG